MIYIASPYSHENMHVRAWRYDRVLRYAQSLKKQGVVCFSPIVYGHQFSDLPTDYIFWREFNDHMLRNSEQMHVLMLEGWADSYGVAYEISIASNKSIPTLMVKP